MNLKWRSIVVILFVVSIVGCLAWTKTSFEEGYDIGFSLLDVSMSTPINVPYDVSMVDVSPPAYDDGLNIEYHDSVDAIQQYAPSTTMVHGVLTALPWTDVSSNVEYYPAGYYKYGSKTYVPTYADSVYLKNHPDGS